MIEAEHPHWKSDRRVGYACPDCGGIIFHRGHALAECRCGTYRIMTHHRDDCRHDGCGRCSGPEHRDEWDRVIIQFQPERLEPYFVPGRDEEAERIKRKGEAWDRQAAKVGVERMTACYGPRPEVQDKEMGNDH